LAKKGLDEDVSHMMQVIGTYGYAAPEYMMGFVNWQVNGLDVVEPSRQDIVEILKKHCSLFLNINPTWHFFDKL